MAGVLLMAGVSLMDVRQEYFTDWCKTFSYGKEIM